MRSKSATRGTPSGPVFLSVLVVIYSRNKAPSFLLVGTQKGKIGRRENRAIRRRRPRSPSSKVGAACAYSALRVPPPKLGTSFFFLLFSVFFSCLMDPKV